MNSDYITIMNEGRDDPDVPHGDTVYTRAAENKSKNWGILPITTPHP